MGVRHRYIIGVFCCYLPLAMGLSLWAWQEGSLAGNLWPVCIALGIFAWTFIEYILHRFVLHLRSEAGMLQRAIDRLHLGHHQQPRDEAKVTVPVYGSLPIAAALLGIYWLMADGWEVAVLLLIGSIGGYLWYETVHFCIHCSATRRPWLRRQRTDHFFHHFRDQDRCFGVTTPLWDWIFATERRGPERRPPLGVNDLSLLGRVLQGDQSRATSQQQLTKDLSSEA